ncbi:MAG: carbon monoxide dehydrogenase [Alcaligenaceae bacterium]|nr:MAG: carbon monoxide dehydrogenase [Alcaligenaceae bacterium]
MNTLTLTVNGQSIQKTVADRTHLGDFLRDVVQLTGTHLGCEHGVCGACTVLLDGEPVRACITYAVACQGRAIITIEGYESDPVMARLRAAFSLHHALQCGYCTPGMLATARDIILRLPQADEQRVRIELAGNLCRCTGYMGIVSAILAVLQDLRAEPDVQVQALRAAMAKGGAQPVAHPEAAQDFMSFEAKRQIEQATASGDPRAARATTVGSDSARPADHQQGRPKGTKVSASFDLPFGVDEVWIFMSDLKAVASCLPGAQVESETLEQVAGKIAIKFGPMSATFKGSATIERDATQRVAVLKGTGQDSVSQSRATGDVRYQLEALSASSTRVAVELLYTLQGPLAQFSRSGLVQEFVRRMVADFGQNVTRRLAQPEAAEPFEPKAINPIGVLFSILWQKIKNLFGPR